MSNAFRRPWIQSRRFEFIEWKLFWEGQVNRRDLEERFEISTPQASLDLRNYREATGDNIQYDLSAKAYVPTAKLRPKFLRLSADRLLLQLRAWLLGALPREELWFKSLPPVDMAPDITRDTNANHLRLILQAIREHKALEVRYQSLTNSRWRVIAPHALAFDGYRWHVRAWANDREDFRDFVITRIDEIVGIEDAKFDPADDILWNTTAHLCLCPHPGLNDEQKQAIQRDYNMTGGCRKIEVRLSMAYYFIQRMNLDLEDISPVRAQIRLENLDEIQLAIQEAKKSMQQRIAERKHQQLSEL